MLGNCWVWNTENNGTLIIKIGPEIKKLRYILSILKCERFEIFKIGLMADEKVSETFPLLLICGWYKIE